MKINFKKIKTVKKILVRTLAIITSLLLVIFIILNLSFVQTFIISKITKSLSEKLGVEVKIDKVHYYFYNKLRLKGVYIADQNNDTLLHVKNITASIENIAIKRKIINLETLTLSNSKFNITLDENRRTNFAFILDYINSKKKVETKFDWNIACEDFELNDVLFGYSSFNEKKSNFKVQDIKFKAENFIVNKDSLHIDINKLELLSNNDFEVREMSASITSKDKTINISDFNISSEYSSIKHLDLFIDQRRLKTGDEITKANVKLNLGKIFVGISDIAHFSPKVLIDKGGFEISGQISGTLGELKAKNIKVTRGENTYINCDFYASGLPDIRNTFFNIQLKKSSVYIGDFEQFATSDAVKQNNTLKEVIEKSGTIYYDGSFVGYYNDFVAKGFFKTKIGNITSDLSFSPTRNGGTKIKGNINAKELKITEILKKSKVTKLNFKGSIDANINSANKFNKAKIEGIIDSLDYNNYTYRNIFANGYVKPSEYEGSLKVNDSNLKLNFDGLVNINKNNTKLNFSLDLKEANLVALNLIQKKYKKSDVSMLINANYSGTDFYNLIGDVTIEKGYYTTEFDTLKLDDIIVKNSNETKDSLTISSNYIDYQMAGSFNYRELPNTLKQVISNYIPNLFDKPIKQNDDNFKFALQLKNVKPILNTFLPNTFINKGYINGSVDKGSLIATGNITKIRYSKLSIKNIDINIDSNDKLAFNLNIDDINFANNSHSFNIDLNSYINNSNIENTLNWSSPTNDGYFGKLSNTVSISDSLSMKISNHQSKININNTLWHVQPSNIIVDNKYIRLDDFMIYNSFQALRANGQSSENEDDKIQIIFNNIYLDNVNSFIPDKYNLSGILNGDIKLFNIFNKPNVEGDFSISKLILGREDIGDISLSSKWDNNNHIISSNLSIEQKKGKLKANAIYEYSNDSLEVFANADNLSLNFLSPLLSNILKNIKGKATGDLRLYGGLNKLLFDGDLLIEDANLAINQLNVDYQFSDYIRFRQDSIIFDNIRLSDKEKHTGIFRGYITHDNFKNMTYNMTARSRDLMLLDTNSSINSQFNGKAYASGTVNIIGANNKIDITGNLKTLDNTDLNIIPYSQREAQTYSFLSFKTTDDHSDDFENFKPVYNTSTDINMKFNINASSNAKMKLIFDSNAGDIIQARGNGNLQINIDPSFNISMSGEYNISWGDYLFTLGNIINKRFSIKEGSSIRWTGSPFDAMLNIKAIYNLKAPLNNLVTDSYSGFDYSQRVPVECYIILKNELNNPDISFDIKIPTVEDRVQDEIRQFLSNEEDVNKQILSLLVIGTFYTPEYLQGAYSGTSLSLMGTTTSELLSNQLSNWLSTISDDFDLGINYRPGNDITDDEVELALSTQLFNNRVTINGNISNNSNTTGTTNTNNNNAFVGDFDILVAISRSRNLQLKAYNHSNNNVIYETSPYKQGIGISYKEDFHTWSEFWHKFNTLFVRKKNRTNLNRLNNNTENNK